MFIPNIDKTAKKARRHVQGNRLVRQCVPREREVERVAALVPDCIYLAFFKQKSTKHPRAFKIPATQNLSKNGHCSQKKEGETREKCLQSKLNKEKATFPTHTPLNRRELAT